MKKTRLHYLIRRTHRFMGVTIGIQLLLWALGGLYFSWSDMDEVHGDYEKAPTPVISGEVVLGSPDPALAQLRLEGSLAHLKEVRLVSILGQPHWQIFYFPEGHERHGARVRLADAVEGKLRSALSEEEAVQVARSGYLGEGEVEEVTYLDGTSPHHEYREQPLPAYAVRFSDRRKTTVYVSTELGTVQKFRNRPWRVFDGLWMLHTMDYQSRDNISNWVLRVFSILGLATVCSGFLLFGLSVRRRR